MNQYFTTIYLDFDEVLYNTSSVALQQISKHHGKEFTKEDVNHWNFYHAYPEAFEVFTNINLYQQVEYFNGVRGFVERLLQLSDELNIITHTQNTEIEAYKEVIIEDEFGDLISGVIHTRHKHKYADKDSILIDDALHNVRDFVHNGGNAILVDFGVCGWNQERPGYNIARCKSYTEIIDQVKRLIL